MRALILLLLAAAMISPALAQKAKRSPQPSAKLYSLLAASIGCPVVNVVASGPDKSMWVVNYDPSCTPAQIALGKSIVDNFDYAAWVKANVL